MTQQMAVWLVVLLLAVAANLPFLNERVLAVGKRLSPKPLWWRLIEWLLFSALAIGAGLALEGNLGQRAPQEWAFYAVALCLALTLAFPGFVWRYLRRGGGRD